MTGKGLQMEAFALRLWPYRGGILIVPRLFWDGTLRSLIRRTTTYSRFLPLARGTEGLFFPGSPRQSRHQFANGLTKKKSLTGFGEVCHTYCYTGPWFLWSYREDRHRLVICTTTKEYWEPTTHFNSFIQVFNNKGIKTWDNYSTTNLRWSWRWRKTRHRNTSCRGINCSTTVILRQPPPPNATCTLSVTHWNTRLQLCVFSESGFVFHRQLINMF